MDGRRGALQPDGTGKEIARANGDRPRVRNGPEAWKTQDSQTLAVLAGFGRGRTVPRDWSDLHRVLEHVEPGEWTRYGDLAEAIGSSPRAVGGHITSCKECSSAHRVLTASGEFAEGFHFTDPFDPRDPAEMLEAEGVAIVDGSPDPARRLDVDRLHAHL